MKIYQIIKLLKFPSCRHVRRRGRLRVSALDSGLGGPGSSPRRGHCVVFFSKTLYSHSASLHPGIQMGTSKRAGSNPAIN